MFHTAEAIRREVNRPALPADSPRYALVRDPARSRAKPVAFPTLTALAAALHRARAGAGLELADAPLELGFETRPRDGVSVWAQGEDGARHAFLGWAWIDGQGRAALEAALHALHPRAPSGRC